MSVIQFTPKRAKLPTAPLPQPPAHQAAAVGGTMGIDLSGKAKCWFFIGRGRIGKTTLARYLSETVTAAGGEALVAAVDPVNRSLRSFIDGVVEPPSADPAEVKAWLQQLLEFIVENRHSALIDLGGGDTSLIALLQDMPDLAGVMSAGGVEPVAIYMAGTDPHDLTPMAAAEAAGFNPRAAAIVLNEAHGRRHSDDFDRVTDHPAFQQVIDWGAIQLWMPLLTPDAARVIDANTWHYLTAKNHLGPFYASALHQWLRRMREDIGEPIGTWFPGR